MLGSVSCFDFVFYQGTWRFDQYLDFWISLQLSDQTSNFKFSSITGISPELVREESQAVIICVGISPTEMI